MSVRGGGFGLAPAAQPGAAGRGITSAAITNNNLILTYSDGTTANVGRVVGADGTNATGTPGRGISSATVNGAGRLIITYTDSTTTDAGYVIGTAGPANTLTLGTVSTLAAGASATASITGTAPNQTLSLGIPTGATGANGPAVVGATASARAIGTTYQNTTGKPLLVSYSVKTQVTNPLLAGASVATVTLFSDTTTTPTTERGRVEATSSVGLTVSLALTTSNTAPLAYIVPATHYWRLVSTTSGTGSTALVSQVEQALG